MARISPGDGDIQVQRRSDSDWLEASCPQHKTRLGCMRAPSADFGPWVTSAIHDLWISMTQLFINDEKSSKKLPLSVRTFVTVFSQTWILSSNINFLFFASMLTFHVCIFFSWIWFLITIFVWQWKKNYVNVFDEI